MELEARLRSRSGDTGALGNVLDALEAEGLLSDARFAQSYVDSRSARGFGPVRIAAELRQRGIDAATRDEACPHDARHWIGLAAAARSKRFGADLPREFPERARQARFLAQRGFSRAQIAAALGADLDDD